jgi:hypothetical protein
VRIGKHGIIPVWRYIHKPATGKATFYAVPVARAEKNLDLIPGMPLSAQNSMLKFAEGLRKRIPFKELKP